MPLMHYTTTVAAQKTAGEVMAMLVRHGAGSVLFEYDGNKVISGIAWKVQTGHGELPFRMPLNIEAVRKTLEGQYGMRQGPTYSQTSLEHAGRVAWRILKDWVGLQMALIETGSVTLEQVFLPYLMLGPQETLYERMLGSGFKALALNAGKDEGGDK